MEENYVTTRNLSFIAVILALTVIISTSTSVVYTCNKIESLQKEISRIERRRTEDATVTRPAIYKIAESRGKITVFYPNGEICETLDVTVAHLPKKDRELLAEGFNVYSMAEFASVIEDYTS